MSANDKQQGGNHYKDKAIQPWDFIVSNNIGYLEGTAIKYLSRWRDKGGVEDLRKAMHFIEKLIETELDKLIETEKAQTKTKLRWCGICGHDSNALTWSEEDCGPESTPYVEAI